MAVWYLDDDDEITEAVARLRGATEEQVVFVIPPGSRIATGRINFKLLGREAAARGLQLAIASPDAQVRAMASSAGVLGLATAADAEAALRRGDVPPETPGAGDGSGAAGEAAVVEAGAVAVGTRSRWTGRRVAAGVAVVLVVAAVGVVASLQTLPTAEVTLTPRTVAVGPLEITITALPSVTEPDPRPARRQPFAYPSRCAWRARSAPAAASVSRPRPPGMVVFSAPSQALADSVEIQALTPVFTSDGVEFRTTESVTLAPPAAGEAAQVTAPIEAARPGPEGNVPAGAIDNVPSLAAQGIGVTNPEPTTGGDVEETPVVTREDVEAAAAALENRLDGELAAHLRDPGNAPQGLTLYPATREPGPVSYRPSADELVGTQASEFRLSGDIEARVLAVDERIVAELAEAALLAEVPDGLAILQKELSIETSAGSPEGEGIAFRSTAEASAYQPIDTDSVLARIAGLPVSEAQAILEDIGATTVSVWPEFLGDLPGDPGRIRLHVLEPSTTE